MSPHRIVSHLGHRFGDMLDCECGVTWDEHQTNPTYCENAERCTNGHLRPYTHGLSTRRRPGTWKCRQCQHDSELVNVDLCTRGHPRTAEYGHYRPNGTRWECLACNRERSRARREKLRAEREDIKHVLKVLYDVEVP